MTILGVVLKTKAAHVDAVASRLREMPGVDLSLNPGDGRLVAVIEDATKADGAPQSAADTLARIAQWPELLSTALVYEYSGPDSPAPDGSDAIDFRRWRESLSQDKGSSQT